MKTFSFISTLAIVLVGCYTTLAFDCKDIKVKEKHFDLSSLNRDFNISSSQDTYPTTTQTTYLINPCAPLEIKDKEEDQCVEGTQICRIITNFKNGDPRIIQIDGFAGGSSETEPTFVLKSSEDEQNDYLIWSFDGDKDNKAEITFICDNESDKESKPSVKSYDKNHLSLEWKSPYACSITNPPKDNPPKDSPNDSKQSSSGWSIFFTVVFCLLFLYFAVGLIYNYLVNHETGIYLIPHLHFWRSFMEVIKDLCYQLYNKCMGIGRGGHGYSAV